MADLNHMTKAKLVEELEASRTEWRALVHDFMKKEEALRESEKVRAELIAELGRVKQEHNMLKAGMEHLLRSMGFLAPFLTRAEEEGGLATPTEK